MYCDVILGAASPFSENERRWRPLLLFILYSSVLIRSLSENNEPLALVLLKLPHFIEVAQIHIYYILFLFQIACDHS